MGIRVVRKGSWEDREVGKFLVGKSEVEKTQAKLERTERSWKEPIEVGKLFLKLERTDRNWS